MKSWVIYFLAICIGVIALPIAAENSIAADRTVKISVYFNGEIKEITVEEYAIMALAALEADVEGLEAKKALAVAARSCAVYFSYYGCKHRGYDACADGGCCIELVSADAASEETVDAVSATEDKVLFYGGKPAMALFTLCSSSGTGECGELEYLTPYARRGECALHKSEKRISPTEFIAAFPESDFTRGSCLVYGVNEKCAFGVLGGVMTDGSEIALALGLPSRELYITREENEIILTSYGAGHGYGLDICAASELAKQNFSFGSILEIFYPKLKLISI